MKDKEIIDVLKDIKGKRLLTKTLMEYSELIVQKLEADPSMFPELLDYLNVDRNEFISSLTNCNENICFYADALNKILSKEKNNDAVR